MGAGQPRARAFAFVLIFILAFLLFAPSAGAVLAPPMPEPNSISAYPYITTAYNPFWLSWGAFSFIPPSNALGQLNNLQIEKVNTLQPDLALTADETKAFAASLAQMDEARVHVKKAQEERLNALASFAALRFTAGRINYVFYVFFFLNQVRASFDESVQALSLASGATNDALLRISKEAKELEFMGAGWSEYDGFAKGTYNKLGSLAFESKRADNASFTAIGREDLASTYAYVLSLASDIRDSFAKGSASFKQPGEFAGALNYQLSGTNSTFALALGTYREAQLAKQRMEEEYSARRIAAEAKLASIEKALSDMESAGGLGYSLVDAQVMELLGAPSVSSPNAPSEKIKTARELVDGIGEEEDGKSQLAEAKRTYSAREIYYLGKAVALANRARLSMFIAEKEMEDSRAIVNSLLSTGGQTLLTSKAEAQRAVDSFQPSSEARALLLARAKEKFASAGAIAESARYAKDGKKLSAYAQAVALYREIPGMLSEERAFYEEKRKSALSALDRLRIAVALARQDSVPVEYYEGQLSALQAQAGVSDGARLSEIATSAAQLEKNLREDARLRYAPEIEEMHSKLAATLIPIHRALPSALPNQYSQFAQLDDKYFAGGRLGPWALGRYLDIKNSLGRMLSEIEARKAELLTSYLEKFARVQKFTKGTPEIDKPLAGEIRVELPNSLALSYAGILSIDVPVGADAGRQDLVYSTPNVADAASSGGRLTLLLEGVDAGSVTSAAFRVSKIAARTRFIEESTPILAQELLRRELKVKFASDALDALLVPIEIGAQPSAVDVRFQKSPAGYSLRAEGGKIFIDALLSNIPQGEGELSVIYELPNPYAAVQTNRQVKSDGGITTVQFDVKIQNNIDELLENVPLYFLEPASAKLVSKSITSLGQSGQPKNARFEPNELGTVFAWEVGRLEPRSSQTYRVTYSFSDSQAYAQQLLDKLSASPEAGASYGPRLESIKALIASGLYEQAIEDMLALQGELLTPVSNQLSYKSQYGAELAKFDSAKQTITSTVQQLSSANITYDAEEINSALTASQQLREQAESSAGQALYSQALGQISQARAKLQRLSLSGILSDAGKELYAQAGALKREAFNLALFSPNVSLQEADAAYAELGRAAADAALGNYDSSLAGLNKAQALLSAARARLDAAEQQALSSVNEQRALYLSAKQQSSDLIDLLSKASASTVSDPNIRKSKFSSSVSADQLSKDLADDAKSIDASFAKFDPSASSSLVANARTVKTGLDKISAYLSTKQQAESALAAMRSEAERSLSNAQLAIEQLAELMPKENKLLSNEVSGLSQYVASAQSSLESGKLTDSLSYSNYIQFRTSQLLRTMPSAAPGGPSPNDLLVLAVSVIFLAAVAFLVLRRKPSKSAEPRKLKKAE